MQSWRRFFLDVLIGLVLPPLASLALGIAGGEPAWWRAPAVLRDQLAGALLALDTVLLVMIGSVARPGRHTALVASGALAGSALTVTSLVATGQTRPWLDAHAVLAAASVAALVVRAGAARLFRSPLDASGLTGLLAVVAITALLAVGPTVPVLPGWLVDALLRMNPVIAVTSAAGIDPLRTEPLYTLSPVAHWAFVYPRISTSIGLYAGVAAACAVGILRASPSRTSR